MKLIGLMLARNEDWVIGLSLRAALMWCDAVVVLMHNCRDETAQIVETIYQEEGLRTRLKGRLLICGAHTFEWNEMEHRQMMLDCAWSATHIALIDADEVLTGNLLPTIRETVERTPEGSMLMLPWLQLKHYQQTEIPLWYVMSSGQWAKQNVSVAFKHHPSFHWKAKEDGYDHHNRQPMGRDFQPFYSLVDPNCYQARGCGLMHFQFLSRRRLLAKQFLYQLIEMKRWPTRRTPAEVSAYYSPTVLEADVASVSAVPDSWWAPYRDLMQYLNIDREPWQEAECKRLLAENPKLAWGLNDFGLMKEWGLK